MRHAVPRLCALSVALVLAACAGKNPAQTGVNPIQDAFGWNEAKLYRTNWLAPLPYVPTPSYCYRTLAQVDCHRRPLPFQGSRLMGYIGPPPY